MLSMRHHNLVFAGLLCALACAPEEASVNDSGTFGPDGAVPDSTTDPADAGRHDSIRVDAAASSGDLIQPDTAVIAPEAGAPILERVSTPSYQCRATHGVAHLATHGRWGSALVDHDSGFFTAYGEGVLEDDLWTGEIEMTFARVEADGNTTVLATVAPWQPAQQIRIDLVEREGLFALTWSAATATGDVVMFAALDADGNLVRSPGPLAFTSGQHTRLHQTTAFGGGLALLWSNENGVYPNQTSELKFCTVSNSGELIGAVNVLSSRGTQEGQVLATSSGFAATWSDYSNRGSVIFFTLLDGTGEALFAAKQISPEDPHDVAGGGVSFLVPQLSQCGDQYIVAWEKLVYGRVGHLSDYSSIQLAKINSVGDMVGSLHQLQRIAGDRQQQTNISLSSVEGKLGLLWETGTLTFGQGFSDNNLNFVVLDQDSLVPASNLVEVHNPDAQFGVMNSGLAVRGRDALTVFDIDYHTYTLPGYAAFSCQ